jgi:hypothetical protein
MPEIGAQKLKLKYKVISKCPRCGYKDYLKQIKNINGITQFLCESCVHTVRIRMNQIRDTEATIG